MATNRTALLAQFVEGHGGQLRRFLRTRVRHAADIPDLIQEVYLRVLRVPDLESIRAPEAYIITIARHVAQQHALAQSAGPGTVELSDLLREVRVVSEADPALEVSAQQCVEVLDEALAQLSPIVQATFLLHRQEGLSIDAVSARLGISRAMTKKHFVKALVHFRKRLKDAE